MPGMSRIPGIPGISGLPKTPVILAMLAMPILPDLSLTQTGMSCISEDMFDMPGIS